MKNGHVKVFWLGFFFAAGLTAWIYWILRQNREVAPKPLVVSATGRPGRRIAVESQVAGEREAIVSDPLEEIKGIGPVFANRLNEAGITTFGQLAAASPAELQEITGVNRWDPADWIAEAKRLREAS